MDTNKKQCVCKFLFDLGFLYACMRIYVGVCVCRYICRYMYAGICDCLYSLS